MFCKLSIIIISNFVLRSIFDDKNGRKDEPYKEEYDYEDEDEKDEGHGYRVAWLNQRKKIKSY